MFSGDDNLTVAERDRMLVIAERLHWLGLAIAQATVSGDFNAVERYESEKRALQAEQKRLQDTARARGATRQEAAEAGPFGGIVSVLKGIPLYIGLGLAAYLYLTRRK